MKCRGGCASQAFECGEQIHNYVLGQKVYFSEYTGYNGKNRSGLEHVLIVGWLMSVAF